MRHLIGPLHMFQVIFVATKKEAPQSFPTLLTLMYVAFSRDIHPCTKQDTKIPNLNQKPFHVCVHHIE